LFVIRCKYQQNAQYTKFQDFIHKLSLYLSECTLHVHYKNRLVSLFWETIGYIFGDNTKSVNKTFVKYAKFCNVKYDGAEGYHWL